MKANHLTAYGNPAQNLKMVEIPEPNAPAALKYQELLKNPAIRTVQVASFQ